MFRPCAPAASTGLADSACVAANVRRLLAREGLTVRELAQRAGLYLRTVRSVMKGGRRPHARTLNRIAAGLGSTVNELFIDPALLACQTFDRATNPLVDELVAEHPELFDGWAQTDFDELYSRFGAGGSLTAEGAKAAVESMNDHRRVHEQVALILESTEASLLADFVNLLYRRVCVPAP